MSFPNDAAKEAQEDGKIKRACDNVNPRPVPKPDFHGNEQALYGKQEKCRTDIQEPLVFMSAVGQNNEEKERSCQQAAAEVEHLLQFNPSNHKVIIFSKGKRWNLHYQQ